VSWPHAAEIKPEWKNAPSLTLVNDPTRDDVGPQRKNPADMSKDYTWKPFRRCPRGGQIKEHWDEALINPVAPPVKNRAG